MWRILWDKVWHNYTCTQPPHYQPVNQPSKPFRNVTWPSERWRGLEGRGKGLIRQNCAGHSRMCLQAHYWPPLAVLVEATETFNRRARKYEPLVGRWLSGAATRGASIASMASMAMAGREGWDDREKDAYNLWLVAHSSLGVCTQCQAHWDAARCADIGQLEEHINFFTTNVLFTSNWSAINDYIL